MPFIRTGCPIRLFLGNAWEWVINAWNAEVYSDAWLCARGRLLKVFVLRTVGSQEVSHHSAGVFAVVRTRWILHALRSSETAGRVEAQRVDQGPLPPAQLRTTPADAARLAPGLSSTSQVDLSREAELEFHWSVQQGTGSAILYGQGASDRVDWGQSPVWLANST
jgi:hypothetical protein